MIYSHSNK